MVISLRKDSELDLQNNRLTKIHSLFQHQNHR